MRFLIDANLPLSTASRLRERGYEAADVREPDENATVIDRRYRIVEWMLADKLDVRFQLQMHKFIWSPTKRGV